jgi:excisionase family DNA binding protein
MKYYTVDEAAVKLRFTAHTIYEFIKQGRLKATRLGKRALRISEENIESFIDKFNTF